MVSRTTPSLTATGSGPEVSARHSVSGVPTYSYAPRRRTPMAWLRRWWQWACAVDRSDRRDYVSWTALVRGEHAGLPPDGTRGLVIRADRQCGELAHYIEFPDSTVIAPLPWPGIELIEPRSAN